MRRRQWRRQRGAAAGNAVAQLAARGRHAARRVAGADVAAACPPERFARLFGGQCCVSRVWCSAVAAAVAWHRRRRCCRGDGGARAAAGAAAAAALADSGARPAVAAAAAAALAWRARLALLSIG